jgi:hypothetical protein
MCGIERAFSVDSRFQRSHLENEYFPGALPQALNEHAPLALRRHTLYRRAKAGIACVSVPDICSAKGAMIIASLGQRPRVSNQKMSSALKARFNRDCRGGHHVLPCIHP